MIAKPQTLGHSAFRTDPEKNSSCINAILGYNGGRVDLGFR
jgi:hypothetical protein